MKCTLTIGDNPCTYAVFDIDDAMLLRAPDSIRSRLVAEEFLPYAEAAYIKLTTETPDEL